MRRGKGKRRVSEEKERSEDVSDRRLPVTLNIVYLYRLSPVSPTVPIGYPVLLGYIYVSALRS